MNFMPARRKTDHRTLRLSLTLGAMLLLLILIGVFLYVRVNRLLNRYMEVQGEKQAETLAEVTRRQFQAEFAALRTAGELIDAGGVDTKVLRAVLDAEADSRFGVLDALGGALYGEPVRREDFPCIEQALGGEEGVSFRAGQGLLFCVPVHRAESGAAAVCRLYPEDTLAARFGVAGYSGSGATMVADADNQVVVPPLPSGEDTVFGEADVERGLSELSAGLSERGGAAVLCQSGTGTVMLYAAAIPGTGFHLTGYVPKAVAAEGVQSVSVLVLMVFLVLAGAVFLGGFLLIGLDRQARESDALREAAKVAEKSSAAKSEFLSNMSHDIRTPMNAIIGFTNLAIQRPSDTERVMEYLGKIQASSNHLLSLINDVLEMSRIESGKIELDETPCSLPTLLHDLNTIIIGQVEAKQQELSMDAMNVLNEDVYCDRLRLNQVLLNLLSNAVKYTPAGGKIAVRVIQSESKKPGYASYEIRVKDNGIGMTPEFAARVFEAFEREKTSTVSGIQGTGLGMAITKSIVDLMGGTIRVETEKDKGSEFIVNVDMRVQTDNVPDRRIPELSSLHALVVDDDFDTCDSATHLLAQIGLRSEWTLSGKEAVLRAKHALERGDGFGVFLIDWKLPDLNGVEAARQIRSVVGGEVPILLMTAYDWPSIREEAVDAGVWGFCNKPLFLSELHASLARVMGRPEDRAEHGDGTAAVMSFAGRRLLLVDDIEMNREIAVMVLEMNGFEVEEARDGTEAVEKVTHAEAGYYDAVLMDIQMPVMNGYEATRKIRSSGTSNAGVPIIAMTANAFDEDKKAAFEAGMDGHVAKPIDVEKLISVLGKILHQTEPVSVKTGETDE